MSSPGEAVDDHADPAGVGDQEVGGQGPEVVEGGGGGGAAAVGVARAGGAFEGPAVVVAADRVDPVFRNEANHAVGQGAVADEVAGADDPVGAQDGQVGPGQLERDDVAVDVGDQAELHRAGSTLVVISASSIDRR